MPWSPVPPFSRSPVLFNHAMLHNATLLRIDPPAPAPAGPSISVRCALTQLTGDQQALDAAMGWGAVMVLYLPTSRVPSAGPPVADGQCVVQLDGHAPATYRHAAVQNRVGPLSHLAVFLAPPP